MKQAQGLVHWHGKEESLTASAAAESAFGRRTRLREVVEWIVWTKRDLAGRRTSSGGGLAESV